MTVGIYFQDYAKFKIIRIGLMCVHFVNKLTFQKAGGGNRRNAL